MTFRTPPAAIIAALMIAVSGDGLLTRFKVAAPVPARIRWGGYFGTRFDSVVSPRARPGVTRRGARGSTGEAVRAPD